jgi:HD-GYP domain-containing protein (c-di-GMP phosphodiesterase class II)
MSTAEVLKLAEGQLSGCGAVISAVFIPDSPEQWHANVRRLTANALPVQRAFESHGVARKALPPQATSRCSFQTDLSRSLDAQIETGELLVLPDQQMPFVSRIVLPGQVPYNADAMQRMVKEHRVAMRRVSEEFMALVDRGKANLPEMRSLASELLYFFAEDPDLYVCLGINPGGEGYPGRHSLNVALLAMAIGTRMGYDENTLVELGVGCMLHDAGMLCVPGVDVSSSQILSQREYQAVASHPIHTCELLRRQLDDVSPTARMVMYQMHERCNGSGYPRARSREQIHDMARIASVADAYVALCSPRPHRPAMMPYYALLAMLREVEQSRFDAKAMRGLLQTVSLFPIGSYLELGEGLVGKVIRTNAQRYDRPIVEAYDKSQPDKDPVIIDLSENPDQYKLRATEPPWAPGQNGSN